MYMVSIRARVIVRVSARFKSRISELFYCTVWPSSAIDI